MNEQEIEIVGKETLKPASELVGLERVNCGSGDHGSRWGMTRDGCSSPESLVERMGKKASGSC